MNLIRAHVQITGFGRIANLGSFAGAADAVVWSDASLMLRERVYATAGGEVRVRIDWSPLVEHDSGESVTCDVEFLDLRTRKDRRDLPSFVQLFLHEVFLLLNLAVPGSCSGVFATLSGSGYRASEIALSARLFEYAWSLAARQGTPPIVLLPLAEVVRWYDALQIGTVQVATSGVAKALFQLLHLARHDEEEAMSILRIGQALAALGETPSAEFVRLHASLASGTAPVLHPMGEESLDARIEELSLEWSDVADDAAAQLVSALQRLVQA